MYFKFGIILEQGSPAFDEFLNLMGEKIQLKGWNKFAGGLDTQGNIYIYKYCQVIVDA